MGFLDFLFGRRKNVQAYEQAERIFASYTAYRPVFHDWNGAIYESELVRAAVDTVARHVAKLKIEYKGSAKPELINRLKKGICPYLSDAQFLYKAATILYMTRNCFIFPVYDKNFQILGYYPDVPKKWETVRFKGDDWVRCEFRDGTKGAVPITEIGILTRYQYHDKYFGEQTSGLDQTMKLLDLQKQAIEENVKNGATYRFYGQAGQVMKESDLRKERQRFTLDNLSTSEENSGVLLFPRDWVNIKQMENKPYSIDADQMKLIKENVYDYFGVNAALIQNRATAEELDSFWNGCIEWLSIQMGEVLRNLIYTYSERSRGNDVFLLANRLQYMSPSQRMQLARDFLDRGIITKNEARQLLSYEPVDGGDVAFIRGEYYTVDEKLLAVNTEENDGKDNQND